MGSYLRTVVNQSNNHFISGSALDRESHTILILPVT